MKKIPGFALPTVLHVLCHKIDFTGLNHAITIIILNKLAKLRHHVHTTSYKFMNSSISFPHGLKDWHLNKKKIVYVSEFTR